jgi:hypothetical protein
LSAHNFKGILFSPVVPVHIRGLLPHWSATAGHNYEVELLAVDTTTSKVNSVLASTTLNAVPAGEQYLLADFGGEISLSPGTVYAILIGDLNAANGFTALPIYGATTGSGTKYYRGLPLTQKYLSL